MNSNLTISNRKTDHLLDLRGTIRSYCLLKICQALKAIKPGEALVVLWNDADAPADLFKILPPNAYEIVDTEQVDQMDPHVRLILRKRLDTDVATEDRGICNGH